MRMLWVSLLLVGSISCAPQQGVSGGGPLMWMYQASPSGQAQSIPAYEKPVGQASGYVDYSGYPDESSGPVGYGSSPELYYSSSTNTVGGVSGSPHRVQQVVPQVGQHGAPGSSSSGPYQQTEESWSSSSDTSGEDEPVFTPVEDEDQVYAFKSRSNYNRKRLLFNQFRYTPTQLHQHEHHHHHHHGKGHHHKDNVKG